MSTCYIAGPMTGIPGFNYRAFDEARDILRTHGWKVISPADLDRQNLGIDFSTMTGNEDLSPWREKFARQDMEALLKVERLFVLEGWEQSVGARNEMTMAAMLGVPICTFPGHDPVEWEAHFSNAPQPSFGDISRLDPASPRFHNGDIIDSSSDDHVGYRFTVYGTYQDATGKLCYAFDPDNQYGGDSVSHYDEHYKLVGGPRFGRAVLGSKAVQMNPYAAIAPEIGVHAAEVRITDPETGGEKGTKLARYDLIPAGPLLQLAEHYGKGAAKYDAHNWRRGYAWSLSFAALQRHAWAFWNGEDNDPETQSHHMAAVAFHAFALIHFGDTDTGTDDRP
jgi:hypothetical protein